ncbi:hypothetical protein C8J57DRAFT_1355167 [Mycena rebaudengoi]|nr:hypothetical protein C8J57DRAFT_1355167 [Mycena rebaudengoi]
MIYEQFRSVHPQITSLHLYLPFIVLTAWTPSNTSTDRTTAWSSRFIIYANANAVSVVHLIHSTWCTM